MWTFTVDRSILIGDGDRLTVIETYSFLKTREEKQRFQELLEKPQYRRVLEFRQTWIDHLTGVGLLEAKRSTLLRQIRTKFGPVSAELVWKVRCLKSLDELDAHLDHVLTAQSLADIGLLRPTDSVATSKTDGGEAPTVFDLDHYRKFLMLDLVEMLTPAETPEEERQFKEATLKPEYRDKGTFLDTWAEQAMMNGLLEGKRATLLRRIGARFGAPPKRVVRRIRRLKSLDELDTHLDHVLTAQSLEDMGLLAPTDLSTGTLDEWNSPEDDEAFGDL